MQRRPHDARLSGLPRASMVSRHPTTPALPRAAGTVDLEAQLDALYDDRLRLHQALGVSSADEIIALVRSMQEQLDDLYAEREGR